MFVAGPSEPPIDGRYNILLLGGDAGPDREGLRPDSISVVSDRRRDRPGGDRSACRATSSDVPFPDGSPLAAVYPEGYGAIDGCEVDVCLLNSIYTEVELKSPEMYPDAVAQGTEPGIEAMRDAAEGITGLADPVLRAHRHAGLRSSSSTRSAASTSTCPRARPDRRADEDDNDVDGWIEPGQQHLDGYHALWYARSRYGTRRDYDRMARQRSCRRRSSPSSTPANVLAQVPGGRDRRRAGREDRHPAGHARLLRRPRLEDEGPADRRTSSSCPTTASTRGSRLGVHPSLIERRSRRRPRAGGLSRRTPAGARRHEVGVQLPDPLGRVAPAERAAHGRSLRPTCARRASRPSTTVVMAAASRSA